MGYLWFLKMLSKCCFWFGTYQKRFVIRNPESSNSITGWSNLALFLLCFLLSFGKMVMEFFSLLIIFNLHLLSPFWVWFLRCWGTIAIYYLTHFWPVFSIISILSSTPETYSELCETSKLELFAKITNNWKCYCRALGSIEVKGQLLHEMV